MKTRIIFLTFTFVISLILIPSNCCAQLSIKEAVNKISVSSVPFNVIKGLKLPSGYHSYSINTGNTIPDKLYNNVQLTQHTSASVDPELGAVLFLKFAIPNSDKALIAVAFGHGYGGDETQILCVVNSNGTILSTLEGTIMGKDVYVKQFRVPAQGKVIVTTIKPTSTTSIPFETCSNFSGYRQDITYTINAQGQFIQSSVQTYKSKTYTSTYLSNKNINLWEGGETLQ